MKSLVGKFTFKVPENHAEAGNEIEKAFDYNEVENESEAQQVINTRKWKLVDLVNKAIKSNARANAYQAALLPYRPSEVSPDDIRERMIRDYIRLGIAEDVARKQVDSLLNATASQ